MMFKIVAIFTVFGAALAQELSSTTQTASCMVCNTQVNVPTPSCGVSATQVSTLQQKLDQLASDVIALSASSCCSGKVTVQTSTSSITSGGYTTGVKTNRTVGYPTVFQAKPGDGKSFGSGTVAMASAITGSTTQCLYSFSTYITEKGLPRMTQGMTLVVLKYGTGQEAGKVCKGLEERCTINIPANQFPTLSASNTTINVSLTNTQISSCKMQPGDRIGWRFPSGATYGSFVPYTITGTSINYCFRSQDPASPDYFADTTNNRSNRNYSFKALYGDCNAGL